MLPSTKPPPALNHSSRKRQRTDEEWQGASATRDEGDQTQSTSDDEDDEGDEDEDDAEDSPLSDAFESVSTSPEDSTGRQTPPRDWYIPVGGKLPSPEGEVLGHCKGHVIDREAIRQDFYSLMGGATRHTKELSGVLFDRWGNQKPEFSRHVAKSQGVWGKELDKGPILLIESIYVHQRHRRNGVGRRLVYAIWLEALVRKKDLEFVLVRSRLTDARGNQLVTNTATPQHMEMEKDVDAFWTTLGFRRVGSTAFLGFTSNPSHLSKRLPASYPGYTVDWRRPYCLNHSQTFKNQEYPYSPSVRKQTDEQTLEITQRRIDEIDNDDPRWKVVDRHGNTIIHIMAVDKPKTLGWLLTVPWLKSEHLRRNLEGETPSQYCRSLWELWRLGRDQNYEPILDAEVFEGYPRCAMACMTAFMSKKPQGVKKKQMRFGCTCGNCIAGFLSPRVADTLIHYADKEFVTLKRLDRKKRPTQRDVSVPDNLEWVHYLPVELTEKVLNSKEMRQGFIKTLHYIAVALRMAQLPTTKAILYHAEIRDSSAVKSYIGGAGMVKAALDMCLDYAIVENGFTGDGTHHRDYEKDFERFPECRNDHEYQLVRQQWLKAEQRTYRNLVRR